ncbi:MAG TPA: hypothetical protein VLE51_00430 [Candidatus Saccharimonadales bacterium]|nr:hypothetical protein [Candidatus Saccharimonadales bacterium]
MGRQIEVREQSPLRTLYYWGALFIVLLIADDATFGWIFWALAQINPFISAAAALVIYWSIGYWITIRGLKPDPGKVAGWFLRRLQLERKNPELRAREERLKSKITSLAVGIPMSLLFGGVLTTLWLRHRNVIDDHQARRVAFWLCGLYALEFGLIHGLGIGGSIFFARQ